MVYKQTTSGMDIEWMCIKKGFFCERKNWLNTEQFKEMMKRQPLKEGVTADTGDKDADAFNRDR